MPINSFEDYPMSWTPDKGKLTFPIYNCLADMMEQDIRRGKLPANTKLPPQRELADYLDLNLSTITKAYKLCEMRGLIHAVTGKGTFVAPYANVQTSTVEKSTEPRIEMAIIHPFYDSNLEIRDLTIELLKRDFSERLFEYSYPLGDRGQITTAAKWLRHFGLDAEEQNTMIAAGAQNALATILSSLFAAGDRIAVDAYTYPNFISLANLLYLQLVPIQTDLSGMCPDDLENVCSLQKIKGVYIMPAGNNPTNTSFTESRKKEIAKVIEKWNLIAIEDDNYASLLEEDYAPLTLHAPEHCIYVSGLSKPVCPGLRIAYLYLPRQYINIMERGMFSQNLKISSLNMEIAAEIIRSGLAWKIIQKKRNAAIARNKIYTSYFPEGRTVKESYYQWLELPANCTGKLCEAELSYRGVSVFGAERFSIGNQGKSNAIRIATCSAKSDEELRRGLNILKEFIEKQEHTSPDFIV